MCAAWIFASLDRPTLKWEPPIYSKNIKVDANKPYCSPFRVYIAIEYVSTCDISRIRWAPPKGESGSREPYQPLSSHTRTVGGPLSATMGKRAQTSPKQRLFTPSPPSSWGATTPPRCPPPVEWLWWVRIFIFLCLRRHAVRTDTYGKDKKYEPHVVHTSGETRQFCT